MKLLYIHQYFAFPDIHSSTRSYDLAVSFVKNNIKVTVITTTTKIKGLDESKRWNYIERDGISLWVLTCNYYQQMSPLKRIRAFLVFMFFSIFKALKIKCDIILATSTPLTVAIPALLKRVFVGTPYIFEVRDIWLETLIKIGYLKNKALIWILSTFEKLVYKKAFCVVSLSSDMEQSVLNTTSITRSVVIPNISEINRFQNEIVPFDFGLNEEIKNKKIILYAGAIARGNGIQYVAELAILFYMINPSVIFLIIGVGNEKERVIEYCRKWEILNKNIFFPDPVPKNNLPYLYSICTMGSSFVVDQPVLWANSANKFFDTLASGRPVLINYNGWQAELIKQKNLGFVLPARLSVNAVKTFNDYLLNDHLLNEQSQNALEIAEQYYSLDIAVNKYLDIFSQIANYQRRNNNE